MLCVGVDLHMFKEDSKARAEGEDCAQEAVGVVPGLREFGHVGLGIAVIVLSKLMESYSKGEPCSITNGTPVLMVLERGVGGKMGQLKRV